MGNDATTGLTAHGPRPVLFHYHIFKNAGTSLDHLLAACFGAGWTAFETRLHAGQLGRHGLHPRAAAPPAIRAMSSHIARRNLVVPNGVPMVMLRHPVDRARSVYQFLHRDTTNMKEHLAASGSFADYITWALDTPGEGLVIRNYQVFHLSDGSPGQDNGRLAGTPDDLVQARDFLAAWPAFGLVRAFAASCRLFQARYARHFPELRLHEVRQNVSPDTGATEEDAIATARRELGETLFARLCAANEFDVALYDFARTLFAQRLRDEAGTVRHFGQAARDAHPVAAAVPSS